MTMSCRTPNKSYSKNKPYLCVTISYDLKDLSTDKMNQQDHLWTKKLHGEGNLEANRASKLQNNVDAKKTDCCLSMTTETIDLSSSDSETDEVMKMRENQMLLHLMNTDKTLSEEERREYAAIMGLSESNVTKQLEEGVGKTCPLKNITIFKVQNKAKVLDQPKEVPRTNANSPKILEQLMPEWDLRDVLDQSTTVPNTNPNAAIVVENLLLASASTKNVLRMSKPMILPDTTTVATSTHRQCENVARTKNHPSQKKRKLESDNNSIYVQAQQDLNRLESFARLNKNNRACQLIDELRMTLF